MFIVHSLVAQSLGLLIGAAVDVATAVYLGPITVIPILFFSGISFYIWLGKHKLYESKQHFHSTLPFFYRIFSKREQHPHLYAVALVCAYVRYGFEGTMQAIYGFDREKLVSHIHFCFY